MEVEFTPLDGIYHSTWASVDHDQHPIVGEEVTAIYRQQDPGHAIVPGYESDGVAPPRGIRVWLASRTCTGLPASERRIGAGVGKIRLRTAQNDSFC